MPPRHCPESVFGFQSAAAPLTRPQLESAQRREKRLACYTEAMELRRRRVPVRVIAKTVGVCIGTIRRWARAEGFPERGTAQRHSILNEFMPYLKKRWAAGCHNALQLWRELHVQGFSSSREIVRYHVSRWRAQLPPHLRYTRGLETNNEPRTMTPPSSRQAMWMLLKKDEQLEDEEQEFVANLCHLCPELEQARELAQAFSRMVRQRQADEMEGWLAKGIKSGLVEFQSFVRGLRRDHAAVKAALCYEWSNGQVEGQVNRLKLIKRQMYGRANFDLLRARVLHAT